jgi:hypothetical protein
MFNLPPPRHISTLPKATDALHGRTEEREVPKGDIRPHAVKFDFAPRATATALCAPRRLCDREKYRPVVLGGTGID